VEPGTKLRPSTVRTGQTRTVIAYRMLAAGTIEEGSGNCGSARRLWLRTLGEDGFARDLTQKD
jgi:hypothetical protein